MKSKGKGKSALLVVVALGIIALFMVYNFVYSKYTKLAAEIEANNQVLQGRVNTLEVYYNNRETYKASMESNLKEVAKILEVYPADVRPEDVIMEGVYMQMAAEGVNYSNIDISDPTVVLEIPQDTIDKMNREEYPVGSNISFETVTGIYVNDLSYDSLKMVIREVFNNPNAVAIQVINYQKSGYKEQEPEEGVEIAEGEEGTTTLLPVLSGNITLNFFDVKGTAKAYVEPDIAEYISGTGNIFGTLEQSADEEE